MTAVTLLESAVDALVRASWQGAILAIVVLGVCLTFRRIPAKWRCGLWVLVLARFLLPVTPQSTISLFNIPNAFDVFPHSHTEDRSEADLRAIPNSVVTSGPQDPSRIPSRGALETELRSLTVRNLGRAPRLVVVVGAVWLLGFVTVLVRLGVQSSRLRRLLRGHRVLDQGHAPTILETCRAESGIRRRVVLLVTDANTAPALAGLIRPRIIVSEQTLATLSSDQLRWLFRHELEHVRRLDVATHYLWWWAKVQVDGHLIPAEYTFRLEKGTLIGSIVKNESGEPIAGVKVQVTLVQPAALLHIDPRKNQRSFADLWATGKHAKTTDAQGRWTLDNVPPGDGVEVKLMLSHPDYIGEYSWEGRMQKEQNISTRSLRERNATIVMHRGISVTGFVIDPDGKKIKDAIVMWGDDPYPNAEFASRQTRTDANGHYRFPPLPSGPITVTAVAKGWAPAQKTFKITPEISSASFQLRPGKTTRIRFVDEAGAAIPEVYVMIERWRGGNTLYNMGMPLIFDTKIPMRADRQGIYEWTWAPDDPVTFVFSKQGFQQITDRSLIAGQGEHVITLGR